MHECCDNRRVPRVAQSFCQHLLRAVHRSQVLDMLTGIPYLRVCSLPRRTPIAANSSCTRLEISPSFGAILSAQFTHGSNDFSDLSTVWACSSILARSCRHDDDSATHLWTGGDPPHARCLRGYCCCYCHTYCSCQRVVAHVRSRWWSSRVRWGVSCCRSGPPLGSSSHSARTACSLMLAFMQAQRDITVPQAQKDLDKESSLWITRQDTGELST